MTPMELERRYGARNYEPLPVVLARGLRVVTITVKPDRNAVVGHRRFLEPWF